MWEAKEKAKEEAIARKAEKKLEKKAVKEEKRGRKSTTSIGSFGGGKRKGDAKTGQHSMFGDLAAQDRAEQEARESALNSRDGPGGQEDYFASYAAQFGDDFVPGAFIDTDGYVHPSIQNVTTPLGDRIGTFSEGEKQGRRGSPRAQAAKEKIYETKQIGKGVWAQFWMWLSLRVFKMQRKAKRELKMKQDRARREGESAKREQEIARGVREKMKVGA